MNRSANMRAIRSKGMLPEMTVRKLTHALGFRFRLYRKDLPGNPDLVFPSKKSVIFVHGCFWHSHQDCKTAHIPKSNVNYWAPKLERNRVRDASNMEKLLELGWRVLVIWECETKDDRLLRNRISEFLEQ